MKQYNIVGARKEVAYWWTPLVCTKRGCPNWDTCFNPAMKGGADYRVDATLEKLVCPMGYDLIRIRVSENRRPKPT